MIDPTLFYSTYLGGSNIDAVQGIALDGEQNVYVTGSTSSKYFPTANPLQATLSGTEDAFATAINPGGAVIYCGQREWS